MGAHSFGELRPHVGHNVQVVIYSFGGKREDMIPEEEVNVAIECMDCHEVLLDFDNM